MKNIIIVMRKLTKNNMLFFIITFLLLVMSQPIFTQSEIRKIAYKGTVTDNQGNPIANATIYGNQGGVKVKTAENGTFSISINPGSTILVEANGYESATQAAIESNNKIALDKSEYLLGKKDVVSTAFKNVKKGLLVGNVSQIDAAEVLKHDNFSRFQDFLTSYGAGIRDGANLLGLGDALVLVDGLPRDAASLQPEEIESITLLKDVNSAVLYGSQAKNGIIYVKTKRGIANKRVANIGIETGINKPIALPKYLNSRDYMTLYNEAQVNDNPNRVPDYDPSVIAKYDGSTPYRYPDVDYYGSDYLKSMYNTTRFVGEFSGGNNIAQYYTSVGWEHQDRLYKSDEYNFSTDKLRARANVDFNITDNIKSYVDAAFIFDMNRSPRTDFYTMASTYRPNDYAPLLTADMFEDPSIIAPLDLINGNSILGGHSLTSKNNYGKNVYGELNRNGYLKDYKRTMQFNVGLIYNLGQLVQGLKFKGDLSFDTYGGFSEAIKNTYAVYEPTWNNETGKISSIKTINSDSKTGVLTLASGELARTIGTNLRLEYDRTFNNDHNVSSAIIGYYSNATVKNSLYADKNSHLAFKIGYNYKNSYIADFSGAVINSVKLSSAKKLSFSPSLGLGWVVSNESFWNKDTPIDYLKLKVSGGILQTDASSNFGYNRFREIYTGGDYLGTGDAGGYSSTSVYVAQTANRNLGMEKMKNINAGFEIALLDKSLFLDANFFKTRYSDQVIQRTNYYPSMVSTFIPYENYNETDYTGIDISLNYKKKFGDFSFASMLKVLYSKSEYVVKDEIYNNDYQYRKGKATDTFWGLKNLGFFGTDEAATAANQKFGTIRRGDLRYTDMDNNGYIDDNDAVAIGNYNPRWVSTMNLSLDWKGFSLFVSAGTRLGYNWVMSSAESPNNYFWVDGSKKYSDVVWGRWTDETAATATYPRLSAQSNSNNFRNSDFWIRNGNLFTVDRLQLNYTLPETLLANTFVKEIRLYLRGDNLVYLSEDADLRRIKSYVDTRNFSFGMKVSF